MSPGPESRTEPSRQYQGNLPQLISARLSQKHLTANIVVGSEAKMCKMTKISFVISEFKM